MHVRPPSSWGLKERVIMDGSTCNTLCVQVNPERGESLLMEGTEENVCFT